jgi:F-type H+-transporting ATPase subunit b
MEFFKEAEFWVLVAAVIFVVMVFRPARRALVGGLDARAARISAELDEARRLRDEAERLVAEYRAKEHEAVAEAEAIVSHAKQEAERIAAQAARDLEQALKRRQQLAEERITQAEAKALSEVRAAAIDVAIAAARDVIADGINQQRGAALLDAAIVALPQRLR